MPDREKVIRGLVEISDHMQQVAEKSEDPMLCGMFEYWHEMAEDALALIREQEPVKPKEYMSRVNRTEYLCGACDSGILFGDKFCRHCGRKVKWL